MSKVTVQSIADSLGLSKFAVSRALSGKPGVSDETRSLVVETAARMGYRTPVAARPATRTIRAVLRDEVTARRESWTDVRHGVELQAARETLDLEIVTAACPDEIGRLAAISKGLLIIGPHEDAVYDAVLAAGRPAVAVTHRPPPLVKMHAVSCTDHEAGAAVGELLARLGHRRLVYVHGQPGFPGRMTRLRGFRAALEDVADAAVREIVFDEDYTPVAFLPALRAMVAEGFAPTGFFCGSDGIAVTVLNELHRLGLRVPQDCSVVGHGDYGLATQVTPHLSTTRMPNRDLGIEAVRLLRQQIDGEAPWSRAVRLGLVSDLVERGSTAPAGAPDWARVLSAHPDRRAG